MRTIIALVLFSLALSIADEGFRISKKSEVKNWESDSKFLNGEAKRDVAYGTNYKLEVMHHKWSPPYQVTAFSNSKLTLNGLPEKSNGALLKGVTSTANRFNVESKTTIVLDVDFGGKDILPSTSSYTNFYFNIGFPSYRNKYEINSYTIYAWEHDTTGFPTAEFHVDNDDDEDDFSGEFSTDYFYGAGGEGFTRFVIILNFNDATNQCPLAIDNFSLLEASCVPPAKNGKPRPSKVEIGQLFQDAGHVSGEELDITVKNCYGYDKKICQKVLDPENSYIYYEEFQAFKFNKPCRGIPTEYACVTTIDIDYKRGSCKTAKAQVIIPVNNKAIQNKYGKAECRMLPAYEDVSDVNKLFESGAVKMKDDCAHYQGCFQVSQVAQVWYDQYIAGDGDIHYTVQPPYTPSQCRTMCTDQHFDYFAIYEQGYQCACLYNDDYQNELVKRAAATGDECKADLALCPTQDDNGDQFLSGTKSYCGTSDYALVYNIQSCKLVGDGWNYNYYD